jgi:hypothetical protein
VALAKSPALGIFAGGWQIRAARQLACRPLQFRVGDGIFGVSTGCNTTEAPPLARAAFHFFVHHATCSSARQSRMFVSLMIVRSPTFE